MALCGCGRCLGVPVAHYLSEVRGRDPRSQSSPGERAQEWKGLLMADLVQSADDVRLDLLDEKIAGFVRAATDDARRKFAQAVAQLDRAPTLLIIVLVGLLLRSRLR